MVLMVFFSSSISPLTSTVILRLESPRATAVVTSAILRTCEVRLLAIELTLSVRSFQVPATPRTWAWPPSLPSVPTSRATRDLGSEGVELIDHRVERVLELQDLAFDVDGDLLREVAVGYCGSDVGDVPHLAGKIRGHRVDVVGEILPGARHAGTAAWPPSSPSVPTSRATRLTSPANALSWSTIVLMVFFSSRISPRTSTVIFLDSRRWQPPS